LAETLLREESLGEAQIIAAAGLADTPITSDPVGLNR
jgi:hypothetical protein